MSNKNILTFSKVRWEPSWSLYKASWRPWLFRLKLLNFTDNWISNHIQAVNQAAASENEKLEKLTVIQKLEETQRELKVPITLKLHCYIYYQIKISYFQILSYTEMLAEKVDIIFPSQDFASNSYFWKTLYQLQWENDLLKEENDTLIKVLAKIKK